MKKKIVLSALIFVFGLCELFGAKADFEVNGKLPDYLYVNSPEGLRVRDKASLSANKIASLYDRMMVKPLEVGPEVTIDGIKSNWIKIFLPVEKILGKPAETGWVFGGYLSKTVKPFSTAGWTDDDLVRYLTRFAWCGNSRSVYSFTKDGKYSMGLLESSYGEDGTYKCSWKNKTVTLKIVAGDDQGDFGTVTATLKVIVKDEKSLTLEGTNSEGEKYQIDLTPAFFTSYYFYPFFDSLKDVVSFDYYPENLLNSLFYNFSADLVKNMYEQEEIKENFMHKMMIMGITLPWNADYMKQYQEYWN